MPIESPASSRPDGPPSLSVLVSSCDSYSDLWPYFFHFLFLHWKQPSMPVQLISNRLTYLDDRVRAIQTGEDLSWSSNLANALAKVTSEYVILVLEDFFMDRTIDDSRVVDACNKLHRAGGKYLALDQFGDDGELLPGTDFRVSGGDENLHAGLNLSLWRVDFLREISQPGMNIWKTEAVLRNRNRNHEPGIYYMRKGSEPIFTYRECVRGRFWKPEGLAYLRANGIEPDLKWRPCPPQGEGFFAKLVRSFHKHRMERARDRLKGKPATDVLPLAKFQPSSPSAST